MPLALLFSLSVVLSGCLKVDVDIDVSRFNTFSGTALVATADELDALDSLGLAPTARLGEVFRESPGVEIEDYREDGFSGEKAVFSAAPFSLLENYRDESSTLSLRRESQFIIFEGTFDFGSPGIAPEGFIEQQTLELLSDINVSVSFPGEVVETNGTLEDATNTVTWSPALGEKNYFYAKASVGPPIPIWAWGLIGPAIVGAGYLMWRNLVKR